MSIALPPVIRFSAAKNTRFLFSAWRRQQESFPLAQGQPTHCHLTSFFWVSLLTLLDAGSLPGFQNRQHFLGEECQTPLRDMVRRATEAEGDVPFEIAQ